MDTNECLYSLLDEWLERKNQEGYIYGTNGLLAVINFIDYIKEKVNANNNIDREGNQGDKAYNSRPRIESRDLLKT